MSHLDKIKTLQELAGLDLKKSGKKVGFTSGVFDLLHEGHVGYLESARELCDFLIVGINSDESVRALKGASRPINSSESRARVLAGLSCVDAVFVFSDSNNNKNIEILKPDVYIKAGDYTEDKLSSAPLVRAYGGAVEIVKFTSGKSTTEIVHKILSSDVHAPADSRDSRKYDFAPALLLDRDGTLIEHVPYLHEPEKVLPFPGVFEALKRAKAAGFRLVVTTNQPGIGLGYFTKEDFFRCNSALLKFAHKAGVGIDKVYFSPATEAEESYFRKPAPGMVERARAELNLDLQNSFVIGDTTLDVEMARRAGCRSVLVQTGLAGGDKRFSASPDFTAKDLIEAVDWILARRQHAASPGRRPA